MTKGGYIYILTNKGNTVLYTGVTSDLIGRIWEHKNKIHQGFTSKFNVTKLVYFEHLETISEAIAREKQIKGGSRATKILLIESINLKWDDLYQTLLDEGF